MAAPVVALAATLAMAAPAASKVLGANGRIAFDQMDPANPGGGFSFTANADGTDARQLVPSHTCCARWSPDGSKLALGAAADDGRITTATVNPDGSGYMVESLPDPTLNLGCNVWSPDSSRLACEGWDDVHPERAAGVFTVRVSDFGDLVRLTSNPFGGHDIPGDSSPDGTRIAFWRENPPLGHDRFALFVVTVRGGAPHQITGWQGDFGGASWSPDGQWILTDNSRGGLYALHPDGSGRHQIPIHVASRGFAREPGWSPDGSKIVFTLFTATGPGTGQSAIYTANADGSNLISTGLNGDNADWGAFR